MMGFAPRVSGPIPAGARRALPRVTGPGTARQSERLGPQFAALQSALESDRIQPEADTDAVPESDPELVVVFELAGTVSGFARAVDGVEGLEFLAELADEALEADDDFRMLDANDEPVTGDVPQTLYLAMSNARAVAELVRLFELWQLNPGEKFEQGLNPWRGAFGQLRAVRRWSAQDRVRDTGLLEQWQETVALVGGSQSSVRVEIDLGFRGAPTRRNARQSRVGELVERGGGRVVHQAAIPAVRYHGLLADLPHRSVQQVLEDGPEAIELLTTDDVMFVSPMRAMALQPAVLADEASAPAARPVARTDGGVAPRVAVLDGLPLANHQLLQQRLLIDDPDDRTAAYTAVQQHHGTAVASLICHGDLSGPDRGSNPNGPLYVRPILQPHPDRPEVETVLRDELLVDVVHRAFRRMFNGEAGQPPTAPSVRIVNLSVGDPARVFVREVSPLARLLDWLAYEYNVLIVVSAGNHAATVRLAPSVLADPERARREVLDQLASRARQRRVLAPAEAVNVLTVGAQHADGAIEPLPDTVIDVLAADVPALYTPVGFGHARSVKPELLAPGGRLVLQRPPPTARPDEPFELTVAPAAGRGPGLRVAAPDPRAGNAATGYVNGTSHAAALTSRAANQVMELLAYDGGGPVPLPDPQYHPVVTKALLVHAARWGMGASLLGQGGSGLDRRTLTQLLGYGAVQPDEVATAARHRPVLLGAGTITKDERHHYEFPLPPALRSTTDWRRLTLTLAWFSPIMAGRRHRVARLKLDPPRSKIGVHRTEAYHHAVVNGTVQHEVLEGTEAVAFVDGDVLAIEVDCRIDGAGAPPIRYGIAASLEVAPTLRSDIHEEVRQGLIQIQQRQQQQIRT